MGSEARKVWSDPDQAVAQIRKRIADGAERMTIYNDVVTNPQAYGALRGSSRLLDRFGAAGAERKQALESVKSVAMEAANLQSWVSNGREKGAKEEAEHRRRMAKEVPGLSEQTAAVLKQIRETKDSDARDQIVIGLSHDVRQEIAQLDKALSARFGNYRDASDEAMSRRLSAEQAGQLKAARAQMNAAVKVIRAEHVIEYNQRKMARGVSRGPVVGQ
ncbi:BID domain-containing protein [Castellaniella sp.]|uniref:BID domain-containing protein n=1 Tax=Castellaniella sp. TaxID=1955812 RepID=UPI002AFE705A|nr:BID domain-containing protein [Castellaniella sp.]